MRYNPSFDQQEGESCTKPAYDDGSKNTNGLFYFETAAANIRKTLWAGKIPPLNHQRKLTHLSSQLKSHSGRAHADF